MGLSTLLDPSSIQGKELGKEQVVVGGAKTVL